MKGLLDTHAFIRWDSNPSKLSVAARAFVEDPANEILLSVVSDWEAVIKQQLGKLAFSGALTDIVDRQSSNGLGILPIALEHVLEVQNLPMVHKDPFDRLLVAQARVEGATLITADPQLAQYGVAVLW